MRKDVEAYLKKTERSLFAFPRNKRKAFLQDFRGCVNSYLEDHPMAPVQALEDFFGTPEAIAESFLHSDEFSMSKKLTSSKRRIVRVVLTAVCALAACALILGAVWVIGYYSLWKAQQSLEDTGELRRESYEIVVSDVSWEEALAHAREKGGKLACFESMEEYRFVLGLIAETGRVENMYFSLGGRRDPDGDDYYWVDANNKPYGKPLNGKGVWCCDCWGPGEPNLIYEDRQETVVVLYYNNAEARWAWYDGSDTYRNPKKTYGYIIEYPAVSVQAEADR